MEVVCSLVLVLTIRSQQVIVTEPVRGTVLSQSDLRYEVDFSKDVRRIVYRDTSIDWSRLMIRKDLCVSLR